jgi:hypothetical protein
VLLIVFLIQCDDSDNEKESVVCTKDLRIVKVLPNRNPIAAPILIIGKSFNNSTKVTFKEIESEIMVINDSTITTSAPIELKETLGLIELSVIDANCSFTTGFTVTHTFEDVNRVSPPTIFFPDSREKVRLSINDFDCIQGGECAFWGNIWGDNHTLIFSPDEDNDGVFAGYEGMASLQSSVPLLGRVKADKSIEVKTYSSDDVTYRGDHLEGGFYKTTLLTRDGMVSDTFLFLQSTVSGRQYIFRSVE